MSAAELEFAALVDQARGDPNILGLLLTGSRGLGGYVTPESDYDAYLILREADLLDEYAGRFPSTHGDPRPRTAGHAAAAPSARRAVAGRFPSSD